MTVDKIKKCTLWEDDEILKARLKHLIKECLRELADEKQFTETQYKALWIKQPTTTDGFKCNG